MLTHLHIKNFTIVEECDLQLKPGMSAITGETGAGKSIMIDALSLALGGRADRNLIRANTNRCDISASFNVDHNAGAMTWLNEQEFNADSECLLRRTLNTDGRSRCYINGYTCTVQQLKTIATHLVSIHGQHENQTLLQRETHRQILDSFSKHSKLITPVEELFYEWQDIQTKITDLEKQNIDIAYLELLRYQVDELDKLALTLEEYEQLNKKHKTLSNAGDIVAHSQTLMGLLRDDDFNVIQSLHLSLQKLIELQKLTSQFDAVNDCLNQAVIQCQEAVDEIESQCDAAQLNPEALSKIDDRLQVIHDVARKHKVSAKELPVLSQQLKDQLEKLSDRDQALEHLIKERTTIQQNYFNVATQLHESRVKAAKKLGKQISKHIQELGMPGGELSIACEFLGDVIPRRHGLDKIEFLVKTNPGSSLGALNKIASGGELSRISLAIQMIATHQNMTPCLLFDEVDVGIGGATAEIVGKLLHELGTETQVICVTHLPQVASQAHQHLQVQKNQSKKSTSTTVIELQQSDRVKEIARMLGGVKITDQSLAHAEEMLS